MKHFIFFLIIFLITCFTLPNLEFAKKTRHGESQESFEPLTSKVLPFVLAKYLSRNFVKFEVAKIPNHVKDLFQYNKDFSIVYREKPKYTLILIKPSNNQPIMEEQFKIFESKLRQELKYYPKDYNIIYRLDNTPIDYPDPYDKIAVKSLLEQCKNFCMIDPSRNTIFTLKRISNTEAEVIPILLQEYHGLLK